ncbi:MAG: 1-acyl-sn-glycerol-3-phosphate acyltransferase [Ruminococcaceae bacterium]|nr:1-acyl-sn-glycerol-3-phosphate acyltransferase [Oscillospiraceae bacterium]
MTKDVQYGKKPYNTAKYPIRQPIVMTALLALVSRFLMPRGIEYKIEKFGMEDLKPPYMLLSNHMYFVDFQLSAMATFPHRVNNVATIDGYYRRPWLMELLGCICKRKFTTDLHLIRAIRHVLEKNKDVLCMYPEARYSPVGTTAILPDALGKMIKLAKAPVVVMVHHGNYLHTPFWNYRKPRKVPLYTTLTKVLTAEEVAEKSVEEINRIVREAMQYDEYRWQREQNLRITEGFRAEGLHKVLYQCPACKKEHQMSSEGTKLFCTACGKQWEMDELGVLHALEGETEFTHIPDWYEWQRAEVRREIEEGRYHFEDTVDVYSLPRCWRFEHLGEAVLTHDIENGFVLKGTYKGEEYEIERKPVGMYGLHVEYDYCYIKPYDCVDISTDNDSFYCYPTKQNVVTKLSLATEELHRIHRERMEAEKAAKKSKRTVGK